MKTTLGKATPLPSIDLKTSSSLPTMIAMPSPLYSGAALIHLATLTGDETLGWDYYATLAENEARAQGGLSGRLRSLGAQMRAAAAFVGLYTIPARKHALPVSTRMEPAY